MRLEGYLSRVAAARPDAIAVVMGEERVSYGELDRESDGLARLLVDQGVRPGDRVCLLTEKSPLAVMAMHAVLKAGAAYVPLDVDSPAARTKRIVGSADPALVLADARLRAAAPGARPRRRGTRSAASVTPACRPAASPARTGSGSTPARSRRRAAPTRWPTSSSRPARQAFRRAW